MNEITTEPLATPAQTAEAPQPTESANSRETNPPEHEAGSLSPGLSAPAFPPPSLNAAAAAAVATARKSPGKVLLYAAVALFGILALDFLVQVPRWMKDAHVRRVQRIVDTVTPASVITRCGQPLNDVTEDLYPMIARRMTYNSTLSAQSGAPKVVFFFTRTAEENSDWVYTSMKDEAGTTFVTPDEQAAALPCLASTK